MTGTHRQSGPSSYMDPYLAGVGLGLVLLAAFLVAGRGLGASGAFAVAAGKVASNQAATDALTAGASQGITPSAWIILEVTGVLVGGFLSAWLAGRVRSSFSEATTVSRWTRTMAAFGGGLLMAIGSLLAGGCTSGQGLTGGALLNTGSWIFLGSLFAGGYLFAPVVKHMWRSA